MKKFVELLKKFEGLHRLGKDSLVYPYRDCIGVLTIGIGTIKFDPSATPWTIERCYAEAESESLQKLKVLLRYSPKLSEAPDAIRDAVLSWCYNLGMGAYKASTFKKRIDQQDWVGAAIECRKWVYAGGKKWPGLIIRREIEARMIETGRYV